MRTRTVLEGNAFYEIDEECLEQKKKRERESGNVHAAAGQKNMQNRKNSNSDKPKGRE